MMGAMRRLQTFWRRLIQPRRHVSLLTEDQRHWLLHAAAMRPMIASYHEQCDLMRTRSLDRLARGLS